MNGLRQGRKNDVEIVEKPNTIKSYLTFPKLHLGKDKGKKKKKKKQW
jgi:hypothetical protein